MTVDVPRLAQVSGGSYAWLQPDGGWGLSNAGLIVGEAGSVLVDTLFDLPRTRRMLAALEAVTASAPIRTVVNTHGNGDHWFGNEFAGITPTYPTRTFDGELALDVGGVQVVLIDVGPAHTAADTVVYCERDSVVFTGDIVFAGATPVVWAGPVSNWITACRRIADLGAEHLVPGHGSVSPVSRAQDMVDYLEFVHAEASHRHDRGMSAQQAAREIELGSFAGWPEAERLAVNVATVYRELDGDESLPNGPVMYACMAELAGYGKY